MNVQSVVPMSKAKTRVSGPCQFSISEGFEEMEQAERRV